MPSWCSVWPREGGSSIILHPRAIQIILWSDSSPNHPITAFNRLLFNQECDNCEEFTVNGVEYSASYYRPRDLEDVSVCARFRSCALMAFRARGSLVPQTSGQKPVNQRWQQSHQTANCQMPPPSQGSHIPANTGHSPNVVSMLAHRLRRWPNIETALGECPVFPGIYLALTIIIYFCINHGDQMLFSILKSS